MPERKFVCNVEDVEMEDIMRFDDGKSTYAIIRCPAGNYYATDGLCTHEKAHLADGLVDGYEVECPRHHGSFDYRTGLAAVAPACVRLKTHKVEIEDGKVYLIA